MVQGCLPLLHLSVLASICLVCKLPPAVLLLTLYAVVEDAVFVSLPMSIQLAHARSWQPGSRMFELQGLSNSQLIMLGYEINIKTVRVHEVYSILCCAWSEHHVSRGISCATMCIGA
jgi:hypothetical protein